MKVDILVNGVKQTIETNDYTPQQLRANWGLWQYADMKEDEQNWQAKWNALPNDVKKSALGEFLKKVANNSGANL
jgi:hypothetical protein